MSEITRPPQYSIDTSDQKEKPKLRATERGKKVGNFTLGLATGVALTAAGFLGANANKVDIDYQTPPDTTETVQNIESNAAQAIPVGLGVSPEGTIADVMNTLNAKGINPESLSGVYEAGYEANAAIQKDSAIDQAQLIVHYSLDGEPVKVTIGLFSSSTDSLE